MPLRSGYLEIEGGRVKIWARGLDLQRIASWILRGAIAINLLCTALIMANLSWRHMISCHLLSLKEMRISGVQMIGKEEIRNLAGIRWGEGLLNINVVEVCNKIKKHPWIAEVSVKKEFPDTLEIRAKERKPVAALDVGGQCYLMDEKGELFLRIQKDEAKEYLLITGIREGEIEGNDPAVHHLIWNAVGLYSLLEQRGLEDFDCIQINRNSGLHLVSRSRGLCVNMGNEEFEARIDRLKTILGLSSHPRFARIVSIDLSFRNQAIIKIQNRKESQIPWGKG